MEKDRKTYDINFKKKVVEQYQITKNYAAVAREFNIHRKNVQRWVNHYNNEGTRGLRERRGRKKEFGKVTHIRNEHPEQKIKRLEAENEFLKKLLSMKKGE
ncbi:helix-turn-helix domain-containing protein [Bacillus sp. SM2101]|uniref:helix-turn-helix domain-containing protein n=1 Tax=Bacillus sp. SM2101 TaxID=2805366 RepID=UPI001BDF5E96|nr:helix-turn-helix domain-containing protein [Bacillus sp. SM2101]